MDEEISERVGLNEGSFRMVNESIRKGTVLADVERTFPFVCECAALGCTEIIEVPLRAYEEVRRNSRRFLVARGHDLPEVERVVADTRGDHVVVEKVDEPAAQAAERTDPRRADGPEAA